MLEKGISKENYEKFASLHKQIKALEKEYDKSKDLLKEEMIKTGVTDITDGGITVSISESSRETIAKDAADQLFIKGLTVCLKQVATVDVARLRLEIGNKITQDEFDRMVKITPVKTMRVK